ncbi:hypothetical protein CS022_24790 [Veronia nyctiphanis]|uniref:Uncharacterized protein n=1 Tax=Veronia nyctiphanis TaxID=1278244 RepID=A0A4Q0Y5F1_9GAMM|nr:hypothetical protein [Veronia nyctiphanis]RXJ65380.1 hypothetical protein CS022_24790 [Veronia nyctiphanis]
MIQATKENIEDILNSTHRLEGGSVTECNVDFINNVIEIAAYPEFSLVKCKFRLEGVLTFRVDDPNGCEFFGLSGYPNSLEVVFDESTVLLAIGSNESKQDLKTLKSCNFYVHAEKLFVEILH